MPLCTFYEPRYLERTIHRIWKSHRKRFAYDSSEVCECSINFECQAETRDVNLRYSKQSRHGKHTAPSNNISSIHRDQSKTKLAAKDSEPSKPREITNNLLLRKLQWSNQALICAFIIDLRVLRPFLGLSFTVTRSMHSLEATWLRIRVALWTKWIQALSGRQQLGVRILLPTGTDDVDTSPTWLLNRQKQTFLFYDISRAGLRLFGRSHCHYPRCCVACMQIHSCWRRTRVLLFSAFTCCHPKNGLMENYMLKTFLTRKRHTVALQNHRCLVCTRHGTC